MNIKQMLIVSFLLGPGSTLAGTETWSFSDVGGSYTSTKSDTSDNGANITISAFSISNPSSSTFDLNSATQTAATLAYSSGYGLVVKHTGESTSSPDHAIDSMGSKTDFVVFDFGLTEVSLNSLDIGWAYEKYSSSGSQSRADITLWSQNSSGNWQALGNLADLSQYTHHSLTTYQSTLGFSKQWAVSAYNQYFSSTELNNGGFSGPNSSDNSLGDAFKLTGLSVDTKPSTDVPEPAAWALLGIGLLFLRRKLTR